MAFVIVSMNSVIVVICSAKSSYILCQCLRVCTVVYAYVYVFADAYVYAFVIDFDCPVINVTMLYGILL